jgi:hypothetical protein
MVTDDPLPSELHIRLADPLDDVPRLTRTRLRGRG